jgi:hypothetical protein
MSTLLHEILYTDSQDMVSLHQATTAAVQMTAQGLEIMDGCSMPDL